MDKHLWLNLGIGIGVGAIAFFSNALSLPLSIAACFVTAAAMNLLTMPRHL